MNPEILEKNPQPEIKKENFLKEITKFTLIALAIIIPLRMFIAQPFIVNGASMDPTFKTGQYLIVDQVSYRFEDPKRQDVIILRYPRDPSTFFIKRIIGLPGETVTLKSGIPTITNKEHPEGITLDETYIDPEHRSSDSFSIKLGSTEYFVMGDNRAESSDSRIWGPLERNMIIGRPLVRLLPLSKTAIFPGTVSMNESGN